MWLLSVSVDSGSFKALAPKATGCCDLVLATDNVGGFGGQPEVMEKYHVRRHLRRFSRFHPQTLRLVKVAFGRSARCIFLMEGRIRETVSRERQSRKRGDLERLMS